MSKTLKKPKSIYKEIEKKLEIILEDIRKRGALSERKSIEPKRPPYSYNEQID